MRNGVYWCIEEEEEKVNIDERLREIWGSEKVWLVYVVLVMKIKESCSWDIDSLLDERSI